MYETIASRTEEAVVRACWRQWRAIQGEGLATGQQSARSIIDPEALVLASLAVRAKEQRFRDLLLWWVGKGAALLSVQRLQTLGRTMPQASLHGGTAWFAALAVEAGDARWKRLAAGKASDEPARSGKGPRELHLVEPSTLMLRLRAGFGVSAKADLMAFLIGASSSSGKQPSWTNVSVISEAIGYSRQSVSRAVSEMSLARFIETSADAPPLYALDPAPWARVFRLHDPWRDATSVAEDADELDLPAWRFWSQAYAFLLKCSQWAEHAARKESPDVVHASLARDIVEESGRYLRWSAISVPDAKVHAGERYLAPFADVVEQVLERVEQDV